MSRQLRDYQGEADRAAYERWEAGDLRTALVMATGLGKTDNIAKQAVDEARAGGRALVLAHRDELLNQITARCRMHAPDIAVGRIQGGTDQRGFPITVAMTPTLARPARRERLEACRPTKIIMDECHHASARGTMDILEWGGSFENVRTLGVTATMVRGDERGLGRVWQSVAYERDIVWAIKNGPVSADGLVSGPVQPGGIGWLVPVRGRVVVADHVNLTKAKISKGDYQDNELGGMVVQDVDQIVTAWLEHAADRITVAFTPTVESAEALRDAFDAVGVKAECVFGGTRPAERAEIYARLAAGVTRVLCGVMVTTEGWDCPPVSCVLMARPTKLPHLYQQIVGRGLRPSPETGKRDCLVLDVVGASRGQRLSTLIDLSPGSDYDTSELDTRPCEDCGFYPCACVRELGDQGGTCPRCRRIACICLLGPAVYEDFDLLAESESLWLRTKRGVPFLPAGDRIGVMWPDDRTLKSATWTPGHMPNRGPIEGTQLDPGVPHTFDTARALVEKWANSYAPALATRKAGWRRGKPTEQQVAKAYALGIDRPERFDKARLSDEIEVARASLRIDRREM